MSREEKITALVIDGFPLGETDQLVTVFTSAGNLTKFVAKGARKTKSRFSAAVQPFVLGQYILSTGYALPILRQADIIRGFHPLRMDLARCTAALSALELAKLTVAEFGGEDQAFQLTLEFISRLSEYPLNSLALDAFRLQFLARLGYGLVWDRCVQCGSAVDKGRLNWLAGGVVCRQCSQGKGIPLSPDILSILRRLSSAPLEAIQRLAASEEQRKQCSRIVDRVIFWHTEGKTKTQSFRNMVSENLE